MNKRFIAALLVIASFLAGCKKYDEGPLMSFYSVGGRVSGTWYFQNVTYGGQDSTPSYQYQRLEFIYIKKIDGGVFTWNHNLMATSADENPLEGGRWSFVADRDSFRMVVLKNELKDSVVYQWKINRLAYTEFWMERNIKDTVTLKWSLVKYAF
ncbi:MAG: hypothetical protein WC699_02330 [Bacteroidales bacterium]|jgi:hypothetical protein